MRYIAYIGVAIIFFVIAFFQNIFFNVFPLVTAPLLLLFIFFYTLIFFEKEKRYDAVLLYALLAGTLTDIVNADYIGSSLIVFLIVGFGIMKLKEHIQEQQESHPFVFFLPLFLAVFLFYIGTSTLILYRFQWESTLSRLNQFSILPMILFNGVAAIILFLIIKPLRRFYV